MTNKILKAAFPGKYIQGAGALKELPALVSQLGHQCLVLASPTVIRKVLPQHNFFTGEYYHIEEFSGECCEKELHRLARVIENNDIDLVIGLGGGKTIDTAKIASDRAGLPVIVVPTIASTDAPCSGCAVIYTEEGVFEEVVYQMMNPQVVLVDMQVLAQAPVRFLVSGMGDALATWFEARSCDRTGSMNECGGYATLAGMAIANLCYETLISYGVLAKMANENNIITPALEHIVEANTLLSGIGFESAGLATAHSVHNGLTALEETHSCFHGEKVAFGVLTGLHLTDADPDEIDSVYGFCESIGLPTTLRAVGLAGATREHLMKAAIKTCTAGEGIHKEAALITPENVLNAMIAADARGRKAKADLR